MNELCIKENNKDELIAIIKYLYSKNKRYEELIKKLGVQITRKEEKSFDYRYSQNITHETFYVPTTQQTFAIGYGNSYSDMENKIKKILG